MSKLHLVKLSVGSSSVEDLAQWYNGPVCTKFGKYPAHVTRMWPKREAELLDGGSIFWVIKGVIQCRTRLMALEEVIGEDGIRRCAMCIDPEVIKTTPAPRRPFQGWRYLKDEDAPADQRKSTQQDDDLPPELMAALADIGLR